MHDVSAWASSKPAASVGPHCSVVADVESSHDDGVEVSIDENVTGRDFAVRSLNPTNYRREEVWLNIFQVDEV